MSVSGSPWPMNPPTAMLMPDLTRDIASSTVTTLFLGTAQLLVPLRDCDWKPSSASTRLRVKTSSPGMRRGDRVDGGRPAGGWGRPPPPPSLATALADADDGAGVLDARKVAEVVADEGARITPRTILPERVLGRASTKRTSSGRSVLPMRLDHLLFERRAQLLRLLDVGVQDDKADQALALDLVRHADGGGLGDGRMLDQRRLDLGRAGAAAADLDRVVGAAAQIPEAVARRRSAQSPWNHMSGPKRLK